MEPVGRVSRDAAEVVRDAREADRKRLRLQIQQETSPQAWMKRRAPRVGASCPTAWSEDCILLETEAFYSYAEQRLVRCERCPDHGGECAGEDSAFPEGHRIVWSESQGRLVPKACERWREYRIRRAMLRSGVPPAALGYRLGDFHGSAADNEVAELWAAITDSRAGAHWLVLAGGYGTGKTHLASGLVRNLKIARPTLRIAVVNALQLRPALKAYWASAEELADPLGRARTADVAIIENLDPKRLVENVTGAIGTMLSARWDAEAATLITTHESRVRLARTFPDLTGFDRVPECKLSR